MLASCPFAIHGVYRGLRGDGPGTIELDPETTS
jgi:hypothetical protein